MAKITDIVSESDTQTATGAFPDLTDMAGKMAASPDGRISQIPELTPETSRYIYIRGFGITSATDQKPVLGTHMAGPCLILALYNSAQKTAALAHFDANTDIQSLHRVVEAMGGKEQKLEAHLAGGQERTRNMVNGVLDILGDYKNIEIKSSDIIHPPEVLKALAIDARTGATATSFMSANMDKGPDYQGLLNYHAATADKIMPLRPDYVNGSSFIPPVSHAIPSPSGPVR